MSQVADVTNRRFAFSQVSTHGGFWVDGCRMRVLATAETTVGQAGVVHIEAPPGHRPPLHVHHDEDEAYFVIAGHLDIQCGDTSYPAGPGAWVFLPRGVAHTFTVPGPFPAIYLLVVLPGGFEDFFADQGTPATDSQPPPNTPDLDQVVRLAQRHHLELVPEAPAPR